MAKVCIDSYGDLHYPECPFAGEKISDALGCYCINRDTILRWDVSILCSTICASEFGCPMDK